jgi:Fe2+ transport system protein FeoA
MQSQENTLMLCHIKKKNSAVVTNIDADDITKRKFAELGLYEGQRITIVHNWVSRKSMVTIKIDSYDLAISFEDAKKITVRKLDI